MADNLIFHIKFDLEAAVREAQGDADRLLRRLQTTINAKPLAVNLKIPGAGSGSINEINSRLKELVKQWNNLTEAQRITNKTTGEYTAEAKKILAEYTRLRGASESYAQSLKQIDSAAKKAAKQQDKLAEAAYRGSNAFKNQEGYVSRLIKRLAVYASFQYTSQFLTNIREVTAQFELQRISLGAIIQDQQKANQIFAEIKSFALTSPLKILDLTKYAKQVAAYGFAADRVFDVTKRLADISVGLGVDMGRLTLAVSQIKAATVLKASELRQLTETGLPMLDLLSKKLTETQGKLVSAADVMDLISKRAISYEMVEEILYDLTDAGGMFYNMQVKQSQTLFGMWSKLGDAAAIMYDQIGNTSSINAGMKLAIRSIESMMRNWKTTARVLDSVAVAMTVYIVGLKNAAVASRALTTAEATRLAITNKQIIATPKLIASIFGQNAATRLSTTLTKAHTAAMIRQSAATNVLSKGFWKLTAAMLANPWVAVAAAVAGVVAAIIHFTGNAETAAERAEKLNNSVSSLKNLEDTTKPLVDTYNELINKTERTAEEQKKLSEVTHELAKQYPGAITAVGNFGEEIELATDKLNQLYQAEKKARMDVARSELNKTKKSISETKDEIAKLEEAIQKGTKTVTVGGSITGYTQTVTVTMSDEDKGKLLMQIDELNQALRDMTEAADAAEAAMKGITVEALHIERFGAWKKKLTEFSKDVGGIKVKLFDDSTINQFGTLEEALDAAAKKYKEAAESVEKYNDTLKKGVAGLGQEQFDKISAERDEAQATKELSEEMLKFYNAFSLALKAMFGEGGRTSDPRLQNLKEEISLTKKLYDEYHKLEKQIGATGAAEKIQEIYSNTIKTLQDRAGKYGFKFELPFTDENLKSNMQHFIDKMKELQKLRDKKGKPLFPNIGKEIDEAVAQLEDVDLNSLQKALEKKLKELADRISRTKTAKEFYEKILEQTGDTNIATRVSMSIYGSTGEELFNDTVEQIKEAFKTGSEEHPIDLDISAAIDLENQRIDYKKLADIYDKYQDEIIEKRRDTAKKIATEGQKEVATDILNWRKSLAKAKSYEQKRTDIINTATAERAKIIRETTDPKERGELLGLSYSKQAQELAKLAVDEFKSSDDYIKVFQDLDRVSTQTLDRMKKRLEEMIATVKDTENVEGLKTLVEQLDKIKEERETRNPIEGIIDSFKEYAKARKDYRTAEAEEAAAKAEFAQQEVGLNQAIQTAKADQATAQQRVNDLKAQGKENTSEGVAAELALNEATKKVTQATENRNKAVKKVNNAEQKTTDALDAQKAALAKLQKNVNAMANAFNSAASSIKTIADMMGIAEDSELGDIVNGLVDGLNNAATIMTTILAIAIAIEAACWWMLAIGAAVAAFYAIGSWLTGSKVRKANKEIKRQQELLEQLEYTYSRLEKAAEKVFGADFVSNQKQQQKILLAQQQAYMKQYEAEMSKGKKADEEKAQEFLNKARDIGDQIADMQGKIAERMLGTDLTSAARDFAQAWLDAYKQFGNTADAMSDKFHEMIENMVVESLMAKAMQRALEPTFKMIDEMNEGDFYSEDFWRKVMETADQGSKDANAAGAVIMEWAKKWGYDGREKADGYTGIAKSVAGATSEEINNVAAIGNTLMYYVSPIPRIDENLARVVALMEGRGASAIPQTTSAGWTDWQQQAMDNYNAIARNTADTVVECRRAAEACEKIASTFRVKGSTKGLNVFLNS